MLSYADLADLAGVRESTLRGYAARGLLVDPDAYNGTSPRWRNDTALRWLRERPGRGNYVRGRR